ncbi:hypothetical protein tb265_12940 [Gemmatimonadetes bacterium T265]|nr:hypothetical protein tb265_12940 [Gemmatimonadetes bacterium T265]
MRARARNALRRRALIAGVGVVALAGTLAALVLVPREAIREARNAMPLPGEKVDTAGFVAAVAAAQDEYRVAAAAVTAKLAAASRATAALAAARQRAAAAAVALVRTGVSRDSARSAMAELDRLLARARTSPLPSSYRALADAPGLRGDPRVRALVDSLDDVERERESYGVGGVDPVYVSLTNRATQLGRAVEGIAERRRTALEMELSAPEPSVASTGAPSAPAPSVAGPPAVGDSAAGGRAGGVPVVSRLAPTVVVADTAAEAARRVVTAAQLARTQGALAAARVKDLAADRRVEAVRARAGFDTPPLAVAAAALVLGAVLGFATAFLTEVRRPRVADAEEAERVTRARVLAVVRPSADVTPERGRRLVDERAGGAGPALPALVDPAVEGYRLLYFGLAPIGAAVPRMAITAAEPVVAAAVALNLAAAAAEDGRSTLVVDADVRAAVLSAVVGVRDRIGLVDLVRAGFAPREAVIPVAVGRDVSVDVLPAGLTAIAGREAPEGVREGDDPRAVLARLARGYDVTVTTIPPVAAGKAGAGDGGARAVAEGLAREVLSREVIVCARAGHTPLAALTKEIARLNAAGAHVRGLVVWDDALPALRS